MEDLKIRVNSEAESKEAQELFFELGYEKGVCSTGGYPALIVATPESRFQKTPYSSRATSLNHEAHSQYKEITLPQLRDLVVLKRNDVSDANYKSATDFYFVSSMNEYYFWNGDRWVESKIESIIGLDEIKKEMGVKELLLKLKDGSFVYSNSEMDSVPYYVEAIEIPEGATKLVSHGYVHLPIMFVKPCANGYSYCYPSGIWSDTILLDIRGRDIFWQRHTLPEELPFIDDEPKYDPEDIGIAKGYDLDELAKEYKLRDRCEGETDEEYRYMLEHCISKETLNDKVASAEVARQEFIGVPFSDLSAFNFGAIDDFVESNVEQGAKHSHYKKDISHLDTLDIYRVTELFNPHSCGAHIAKKALCSGQRGHKDLLTDIQDIIDTAERWKEMLIEDEKAK